MTCPICDRPTEPGYQPFCSRRCADVDLGRWLTGSYKVPVDPEDSDRPSDAAGDDLPPKDALRH